MTLTKIQTEAAHMLFEGRMTDLDVAKSVGVDVRTLRRWQEVPEFAKEIDTLWSEFAVHLRKKTLARREGRLSHKMDRHLMITRTIERRAETADPNVPGAETGLLIKRSVKTGATEYEEYRLDHIALRELNRLETDIAKDLGQDKPEVIVPEEEPMEDLTCLTSDELDILAVLYNKVAEFNPHTKGPVHRDQTQVEKERCDRLVQKALYGDQNTENLEQKQDILS